MAIVQSNADQKANFVVGTVKPVIATAAGATTYNLTAQQSGSVVLLAPAAAANQVDINLPPATTAGLSFEFILTANNSDTITIQGDSAVGRVNAKDNAAATVTSIVAEPTDDMAALVFMPTALANDWCVCVSDGTNWNFKGMTAVGATVAPTPAGFEFA